MSSFHFTSTVLKIGSLTARLIVATRSSNARSPRDPDGVGDAGSQTLEEGRAVFGEASRHGFPHAAMMQSRDRRLAVVSGSAGTSILNDSSFPASFTRDPSGPFPPPHALFHGDACVPIPAGTIKLQTCRPSAQVHELRNDARGCGPYVVYFGAFQRALGKKCFRTRGEFKTGDDEGAEGGILQYVHAYTAPIYPTYPPNRAYAHIIENSRALELRRMKERDTSAVHEYFSGFKVSASLKAAAASTVFPTPCGERTNVADFVKFITAADPHADPIKCKLCEQHIARKDSLVQHWIRVHAIADLQVALMYPHEDHSDLVINTTQRRDILLAALYTCPLKGCRGLSTVRVYVTKGDLLRHVRRHYGFLDEASGENTRDTDVELEQMREQVTNYLNNHTYWLPVDRTHFTSRNYKLVWLLNQ
ncbi:hypothetical protein BU17DRAFT_63463 [Hysterangium stoloniferum]|nr:hypothetical protein BU17DRAFT_63463 [Hysterangium stoloniferum]